MWFRRTFTLFVKQWHRQKSRFPKKHPLRQDSSAQRAQKNHCAHFSRTSLFEQGTYCRATSCA